MKTFLKRYKMAILLLIVNLILLFAMPEIGKNAFTNTGNSMKTMLGFLPPVFVLLGLLDVWVDRKTMMKYMGDDSGMLGAFLAFVMAAAAAGPLYAAFPIAAVLLKKGASLFNVFVFVGTWSCAKVPMVTFEFLNMGPKFTIIRFFCNVVGIFGIAFVLSKTSDKKTEEEIRENAKKMAGDE